ncbi:MAG TPA: hypothetical protein VMH81_07815 [Bryobacteraceae bacterium]|nr:hypothetical protein [Bryobacteraceae bacterium]
MSTQTNGSPIRPRTSADHHGSGGFEFRFMAFTARRVLVQRSSANRVTGWISYAYGHTGMRDGGEPPGSDNRFPSEFDQRHTVNAYLGYRLRPTVNVSVHSSYGSGFPIPGFLHLKGGLYYLTSVRNQLRMLPYSRTDLRVNKSWTHDQWKLTLYGEVVNLTNRTNLDELCFRQFQRV